MEFEKYYNEQGQVDGWSDIHIKFVDKGDQFRIHEYDGSESVEVYGPSSYMVA